LCETEAHREKEILNNIKRFHKQFGHKTDNLKRIINEKVTKKNENEIIVYNFA